MATLRPDSHISSGDASPTRRILIVDDHADGRQSLRMLLELLGHQVEVAEDGRVGVQKALDWKPEIALVDIGLPGMDGYQVARELRVAFPTQILLIALTGCSGAADRQRCLEAGFDIHLTKPVDFTALLPLLAR